MDLQKKTIEILLDKNTRSHIQAIKILKTIGSTNAYLLKQAHADKVSICIAEQQTAGRGQFSRTWTSPVNNIYFSMRWPLKGSDQNRMGLSLVVAIAVIKTLAHFEVTKHIGIKWPNDIMWQQRKLAGILIETTKTDVVIGIGINVELPKTVSIDQPWIDLFEITGQSLDRNQIIGQLINQLFISLNLFYQEGAVAFRDEWNRFDILKEQFVTMHSPNRLISGIAKGINENGQLLIKTAPDAEHTITSGEVMSILTILS
ncbi:MAG: biotin--[acetyl-CoA-carboxylase] ligase [Pseudomonadota bacterium]